MFFTTHGKFPFVPVCSSESNLCFTTALNYRNDNHIVLSILSEQFRAPKLFVFVRAHKVSWLVITKLLQSLRYKLDIFPTLRAKSLQELLACVAFLVYQRCADIVMSMYERQHLSFISFFIRSRCRPREPYCPHVKKHVKKDRFFFCISSITTADKRRSLIDTVPRS